MESVKKILVSEEGRTFYIRDISQDFHTQFGFIKSKDLKKKDGSVVVSNTSQKFHIYSPSFIDSYRRIKRGPQIIPAKDVAAIIAETGLGNKSVIVDAGTGSGALACFLANYAKKVVSYELREDFFKIASENVKMLGLKNVELKNKDVYLGIDEKNADIIVFDLPEPWLGIKNAEKALKIGGYLVSYSPTVPQIMDFASEISKHKCFSHIKTIEIMERRWDVLERKVRPKSQEIGHSGFLSFYRKIC
ncbi:MAG: methyltransferase domain-containing protein [Candidatus Woesearchaeota archaeon]|nr:methyltransferase domain-containing protein [Candidatus Woesearchaeota archaeon]